MMKKGRSKLTVGIIGSRLYNFEELWHSYCENDKQLKKQKSKKDAHSDYFEKEEFNVLEVFFLDTRGKFMDEKARLVHPTSSAINQHSSDVLANGGPVLSSIPHRKMPAIAIPKFNGKHSE